MRAISFLLFLPVFLFVFVQNSLAATLHFSTKSESVKNQEKFDIAITTDTDEQIVTGIDANIIFDSKILKVVSVQKGDFLPFVSHRTENNRVEISAVVLDNKTKRSGSGTVATVTFQAVATGTTTVKLDCSIGKNDSSKIVKNDLNATNIIQCEPANQTQISVEAGAALTANNSEENQTLLQQMVRWFSALFGR